MQSIERTDTYGFSIISASVVIDESRNEMFGILLEIPFCDISVLRGSGARARSFTIKHRII